MFLAPPEVHSTILKASSNNAAATPTTIDVIKWVMHETCVQTQRGIPLWATQGLSHQRQQCAWKKHTMGVIPDQNFILAWMEREARTLKELYGVKEEEGFSISSLTDLALSNPNLQDRHQQLMAIRKKCVEFGVMNMQDLEVSVHEEQEREVAQEIQVELPPRAKPLEHRISNDVSYLLASGRVNRPASTPNIVPIMKTLDRKSVV